MKQNTLTSDTQSRSGGQHISTEIWRFDSYFRPLKFYFETMECNKWTKLYEIHE